MVKKKKVAEEPKPAEPVTDENGIEQPTVEANPVEQPAPLPEPTFEAPAEPVKKEEILLTVTAAENFKDGAFKERFAKLGYGVLWKKGETRRIPMNLFVRCIRSGAKFEK